MEIRPPSMQEMELGRSLRDLIHIFVIISYIDFFTSVSQGSLKQNV